MERRRELRREVSWQALAAGIDTSGECRIVNVSSSGISFAGSLALPEKALILLRVWPDQVSELECAARVVWRQCREHDTLYGAEIVHISASDRQALSFCLITG